MFFLTGTIGRRFVRVPLGPGLHRIGRADDNDIRLESDTVSRRHAEIRVADDVVKLRDLKSSNGTWVSGEKLIGERTLSHRDVISFGAQEMILIESGRAATPEIPMTRKTAALLREDNDAVARAAELTWSEAAANPERISDTALLRALSDSGGFLMYPRPLAETLKMLLDEAAKIVPARRILLLTVDAPGSILRIQAAHPESGSTPVDTVLSRGVVDAVMAERRAMVLDDIPHDPRLRDRPSVMMQKLRSAMVAPLFDNREVTGLLYADTDDPGIRYDRNQLRAFTLLANLLAVKMSHAKLLEGRLEMERMEKEMASAVEVQKRLLPAELPEVPGYEIRARMEPCLSVAGDLYDVSLLPDGRVAVVVGDVTGKGVPAAMLMANVMAALRLLCREDVEPVTVARRLHEQVLASSDELRFVTLFLGLLDPRTNRLLYVNAGHNPPLLLRPGAPDCRARPLGPTGMPLGLVEWAEYTESEIDIPADAVLCAFSDGITEAWSGSEIYGEERLLESIRSRCGRPLDKVADGVLNDLRDFLKGSAPGDDMTLMLIRRT